MEPTIQDNEKTRAKARKVAITANVEKGMNRLKKGVTRFVSHNRGAVGGVTLGAVGLVAAGFAVNRLPVRKTFRRYGRRGRMNSALSTSALVGTGAIIGTGLTILLAPRWFMGD